MNQSDQLRVSKAFYDDLVRRNEMRTANRSKIRESVHFDETKLRSLDSALKKTTAFMKKLKNIGAGAGPSLIDELDKLNLSKFIEEIAQAISEVRCKLVDVPFIVDLAVAVSCKYSSFPNLLLSELRKGIPQKKTDKVVNPGKLRVDMRLLFELILNGVFGKEGLQVFGNALAYLIQTDKVEHFNIGLLSGLANQIGWEMARILPNSVRADAQISAEQIPTSEAINNDQALTMKKLFLDYQQSIKERAEKTCIEMNIAQKRVLRQEKHRGDATQEDKNALDLCRQAYDGIKKQLLEMSESLGIPMPTFVETPSDDEEDEAAAISLSKALEDGSLTLWEDDEERYFYERVIDIRRLVPTSLFKESQEPTFIDDQAKKEIEDIDVDDLEIEHMEEMTDEQEEVATLPETELIAELNDIEVENSETAITMRNQMQKFLDELVTCVNRDVIDSAALGFVKELNTKINRRKLVRFLFGSTSMRLDVVPFCARLLATLQPVMPDVPAELARLLIDQFREITRGKGRNLFLDVKLRIISFISELVKFGLIGRAEALSCLRQLVYDFRSHAIDLTCSMLESCGRYLYRNTDSHPKMKQIIDVILRKKEHIKDQRQNMLIENAYYLVCPSETEAPAQPSRPPIYDFVKQLIVNINEACLDVNLKLLRRIDWHDNELCDWAIWTFSSPWLIPFGNLSHISSALSGLSSIRYHEWTSVEVVDNILETIRMALESINDGLNQKAIACIAYIGELYNYNVVNSSLVFKVLYQIISLPEHPSQWFDFTRIRMVSQLLRTSGEFFTSGSGKTKMNNFITYWLRYYWMKREQWVLNITTDQDADEVRTFPPEIEGDIIDTLKEISSSVSVPKSLNEAEKKVEELEATFKNKIEGYLTGEFEDIVDGEEARPQRELHQILEEEEDDRKKEMYNEAEEDADEEELEDEQDTDNVNVHVAPQKQQSEDLDFCRDLDQMLAENFKIGSTGTTNQDALIVPAQARQKLVRRVGFSDGQNIYMKEENDKMRVALMTKGKSNKTVLKNIDLHEESLEQKWKANTEKEKREREQLKKLTLRHTARMAEEEANEEKVFDIKSHAFPVLK